MNTEIHHMNNKEEIHHMNNKELISGARAVSLEDLANQLESIIAGEAAVGGKVPVFGGMKAGKSSLLARVLNCEQGFLPPGVLEATARNVEVYYSFAAGRKVVSADGEEREIISDAEWDDLVRGKVQELAPTDRLVLELPSEYLRELNLSFMDTPGNNTSDENKVSETWNALSDISLGIYCLRSTAILTKSDMEFIQAASYHLDNFIFLVTRVDEIDINDVNDVRIKELLDYTSQRLANVGVKPLKLLAVSSKIEDEAASGIAEVKATVKNILRERGAELRKAAISKKIHHCLEAVHAGLQEQLSLFENSDNVTAEDYRKKIEEFQKCLIDLERSGKHSSIVLENTLESSRLALRNTISALGKSAIDRLKERISAIDSGKELESVGTAMLSGEVDKWRADAAKAIEDFSSKREDIMRNASGDFLRGLEEAMKSSVGVSFSVRLSDDIEESTTLNMLREQMKDFEAERAQALEELEKARHELALAEGSIPELQQSVAEVKSALDSIEYQPEMIEKRYGGNDLEGTLSSVGSIIDWALILTPIPMGKLKWLAKVPGGLKIKKAIQIGNKLIRKKNKIIKNIPVPGGNKKGGLTMLSDVLNVLSVEHWAGKLGKMLDERDSYTKLVEDPVVKQQYLDEIAPYNAKIDELNREIAGKKADLDYKRKCLKDMEAGSSRISEAQEALVREIQDIEQEQRRRKDSMLLFEGRKQLLDKAYALIGSSSSEVAGPLFTELDRMFSEIRLKMGEELMNRQNATVADLKQKLEDAEKSLQLSCEERNGHIELLKSQASFVKKAIAEI